MEKGIFAKGRYLLLLSISSMFWLYAQLVSDIRPGLLALLIQFLVIFFPRYKDIKNNISFILFEICTFMFVEGSLLYDFVINSGHILNGIFDIEISKHIINVIFIGQLFVTIGYDLSKINLQNKRLKYSFHGEHIRHLELVQKYSFYLTLLTIIPKFIVAAMNSHAQYTLGYFESYLGYELEVNSILIRIASFYEIFFWIFLSSKPGYKKTIIMLMLNLLIAFAQSAGGHRSYIVISIIVTMTYLYYRDITSMRKKQWLSKWWITLALFSMPVVIYIASVYAYIRAGVQGNYQIGNLLNEYFISSSANIIGYERLFTDRIPKGNYVLGALYLTMVRNQSIFRKITGLPLFQPQTVELADSGYAFGQTITYLWNEWSFLGGGGLGTSYYAEAFHDYWYIGVILISLMYGYLLFGLYHYNGKNVYLRAFFFIMLSSLYSASRDSVFAFVYNNITLTNIVGALIIYGLVKLSIRNCSRGLFFKSKYLQDGAKLYDFFPSDDKVSL